MGIQIDIVNGAGTALRMNDGTADADGNLWWVRQLDGWGPGNAQVKTMKRMASDGSVVTNATYGSRRITLNGVCVIASGSDFWEAQSRLSTACDSITADGKIRVYEPGGTRHLLVRLLGQPSVRFTGPRSLDFSLAFVANNPAHVSGL